MKNNNDIFLQIGVFVMLTIIVILATYLIVDKKTSNISDTVVAKILAIEYDKVGGMENYVKINKIQKEQITKGLEQYDAQEGGGQPAVQPQARVQAPTGSTISLEQAKKVTTDKTYILGNPEAEITWIEYSDLECPFCKKLHEAGTIDEIIEAYDGKVNFVFKQFPLNFHPNAPKEHEAALCAGDLGGSEKYYSYINTIFKRTKANGRGFSLDALVPLAKELGLDESKFQTCLDSGQFTDQVNAEMAEGQSLFGITGTPGNVLINNQTGKWDKLPGAYPTAAFKEKIDALLQ